MKKTEVEHLTEALCDGVPRSALEIARITGIKKEQCNSRLSKNKDRFVRVSKGVYQIHPRYRIDGNMMPQQTEMQFNTMSVPVMSETTRAAMSAALGTDIEEDDERVQTRKRREAAARLQSEIEYRQLQLQVLSLRKQVREAAKLDDQEKNK